ncbi:MAG: hypothetical protein JWO44_1379 [Bacteroidetes bacterium]|nr:hypothetical protein [Bacteroidota bacterium]
MLFSVLKAFLIFVKECQGEYYGLSFDCLTQIFYKCCIRQKIFYFLYKYTAFIHDSKGKIE